MNDKKRDMIFMIFFPILAVALSLLLKTNFLLSTIFFFGFPAVYLSYKKRKAIKKSLIFAFLFSIPFTIIINLFAVNDQSWYVPITVFKLRILNLVPIEDLIWGFLLVYFVIIFYEYFLDKKVQKEKQNKKFVYFFGILNLLLALCLLIFALIPSLRLPYFYLWGGICLLLVPTILFLTSFPNFISRFVKVGIYFFGVFLLLEITGLQRNQWVFPGKNFIGWVTLFGHSFPFEEFLFFISLAAVAVLSYYEFFSDDQK